MKKCCIFPPGAWKVGVEEIVVVVASLKIQGTEQERVRRRRCEFTPEHQALYLRNHLNIYLGKSDYNLVGGLVHV